MSIALAICSAGDLNACGIATGDNAGRGMGTELSASPIQCQPCTGRACLTPALSLSSGHLCNTLQGDCLEIEEQLKCTLTAYTHTA